VEFSLLSLIVFIVFWMSGNHYIVEQADGFSRLHYWAASTVVAIVLVASIAIHEGSHALVAWLFGSPVHAAGMTAWGAFVAHDEMQEPFKLALVSVAGPTANLVIAWLAIAYVKLRPESLIENSVQYIAVANIGLWRLNMLPLQPLDGGNATNAMLSYLIKDGTVRHIVTTVIALSVFHIYSQYRKSHKSLEDTLTTW
jgi:Zn-dependent protease